MQRQIDRISNPTTQAQVIDVLSATDESFAVTDSSTITAAVSSNTWG